MNMLPISAEWKRRQKWADKHRKQTKVTGQAKKRVVNCKNLVREELKHVQESFG